MTTPARHRHHPSLSTDQPAPPVRASLTVVAPPSQDTPSSPGEADVLQSAAQAQFAASGYVQ